VLLLVPFFYAYTLLLIYYLSALNSLKSVFISFVYIR